MSNKGGGVHIVGRPPNTRHDYCCNILVPYRQVRRAREIGVDPSASRRGTCDRGFERYRLIYKRGCQEHSSPFAVSAVFIRDIQPLVTTEDASLGSCPWFWVCAVPSHQFHFLVATTPISFETKSSRAVVRCQPWIYLRLVA